MTIISNRAKKSLFTVSRPIHFQAEIHVGDRVYMEIANYAISYNGRIRGTVTVFNKKDEVIGYLPNSHRKFNELMGMSAPIIKGDLFKENIHYLDDLKDMFIAEISDCGNFVFIDTFNQNTYDILMKLKKISENSIKQELELERENIKIEKQRMFNEKLQMQQVLKAIEQGKSREEAAKYAKVTSATITRWYNEGYENKSPETKNFYDKFTRIKKMESEKKNAKKDKLKAKRKKPINRGISFNTGMSYSSKPTSYMRKLQGDRTDTSDRARNLREDISGRY